MSKPFFHMLFKKKKSTQTHIYKKHEGEENVDQNNSKKSHLQISGVIRIFAFGRSADFLESFVGVDSNVLHADLART